MDSFETEQGQEDVEGNGDPVFIKKLKLEILEGKKSAMNPVKLAKFKKAMLFTDIRLDFVTFLRDFTRSKNQEPCSSNKLDEEGMKFILTLIGAISSKGNFGTDKFYNKEKKREAEELDEETTEEQAQQNYLVFKKIFSELWSEVMKWKMTSSVHRNVVILLPEKVMTHLSKPLHMSDFLLESFKIGGPVGLVSLHGIFLLMQNFNFEVSDFYTRLYSMFTLDTLSSKYRARFFAYSREFLSSTHLPECMVASFVKRLSRLSIFAPTPALPLIFDFILNLIIQHPGLKILLNPLKPDGKPKIQDITLPESWDSDFETFLAATQNSKLESPDPFDEEEPDPMKTKAIESWLCEIKTLQNHVVSSIALKAKFINKAVPKVEQDFEETLSLGYKDIEDQEREMSDPLEPIPSHIKPTVKSEESLIVKEEGEDTSPSAKKANTFS